MIKSIKGLESPLPNIETSIFTTMSQLAKDEKALNLAQGFPDFGVPKELIELLDHFARKGLNQYAPSDGIPGLREEISRTWLREYGVETDPQTEVTVTSGATEALMATAVALISKGDEVIIFDPSYDSYDPLVTLQGARPVRIKLNSDDYSVPWDEVERKLSKHTKAIFINSPHNPTGAVLVKEDLLRLQEIAVKHDLFVISDEVYHHIIFDGLEHQSVLKYQELAKRSVAVFSFGKIAHATGWKVGFSIAPEYITREIRKVHQFMTFSVHTPTQFALAEYLRSGLNFSELSNFFQEKRDHFVPLITNPNFTPIPSKGTYFQLVRYKFDISDEEMANRMTREYKLASIPVSVFIDDGTDDHVIRFCFAKENDTLEKAAEILNTVNYG